MSLVRDVGYAQRFLVQIQRASGNAGGGAGRAGAGRCEDRAPRSVAVAAARTNAAFNTSCEKRVLPVLFEKPGRKQTQAIGRSPYLQPVHVEGAFDLIGEIRDVRIDAVGPNSLKGTLLDDFASVAAQ